MAVIFTRPLGLMRRMAAAALAGSPNVTWTVLDLCGIPQPFMPVPTARRVSDSTRRADILLEPMEAARLSHRLGQRAAVIPHEGPTTVHAIDDAAMRGERPFSLGLCDEWSDIPLPKPSLFRAGVIHRGVTQCDRTAANRAQILNADAITGGHGCTSSKPSSAASIGACAAVL
ncbi:hypothetical protein [Bradyrhizobium sp. LB13.1]